MELELEKFVFENIEDAAEEEKIENDKNEIENVTEKLLSQKNEKPSSMESTLNLTKSAVSISDPPDKKQKLSILEKISKIRKSITVEPLLGCYIIPSVLCSMAIQNLALELACRVNLGYDDDTCTKLVSNVRGHGGGNATEHEQAVQKMVASMVIWKTPLQNIAPVFIILFLGSYSDRFRRRKPFFMFPLLGDALTHSFFLLCAINRTKWPMEAVGIAEAMFPALTGGTATMIMAVYSYIADITTVENRTIRVGIVHISASILLAVGFSLSGILYKTIGYYGLFSTSICIYLVGFLYAYFVLKEPNPPLPSKKNICSDFFDPRNVMSTFSIIYKKREGNKRMRIILFMFVFVVITGPPHGEAEMVYLFTRTKFGWDAVKFSIFITYDFVIHLIGSAIAISVFSKMLKIDDLLLAAFACVSKVAASFLYAFSETPTLFYCAPIVSLFSSAGIIAMRSIATKLVSGDELGKIQSLFGVAETTAPVIYRPIYSQTYIRTIDTLPGAFFLLGALFISPSILILIVIYYLQKRENSVGDQKNDMDKEKQISTIEGSKEL